MFLEDKEAMTKDRKVELLYRRARGESLNLTNQEQIELRKYKVSMNESSFYVTKANIQDYVSAVDRGSYQTFSDWCQDHMRADRRRRGSSEKAMAAENSRQKLNVAWFGWLVWGLALYWLFGGALHVLGSAILGIGASLGTFKLFGRKAAPFTQILLPVILMAVFCSIHF